MKNQPIKLKIEIDDPGYIEILFADNFRRDNSTIYPIYVTSQWTHKGKPQKGSDLVEITRYNYRVVEALDDPDKPITELAIIKIQPYPSFVLVVFEKKGMDSKDWEKVKLAVREIVKKAQEMDFNITWTDPPEFISKNIIEEKGNRKIEISIRPESLNLPIRPEKPQKGSQLDSWFTYFHDCRDAGIKYTLKNLAHDSGFSYGHVRELHRNYLANKKDQTKSDDIPDNI
jgi:hypothetical protein